MEAGEYNFVAKTKVGEEEFEAGGQFSVIRSELEQLSLTANHSLLRNLARKNGGIMTTDILNPELDSVLRAPTPQIITSRQALTPVIELEWILAVIAFWLSCEWFFRKRLGGY